MEDELKKFIALLTYAEEVTIHYKSTVPDMDDFYNPNERDTMILMDAKVEVAIRLSGLDKVKASL